MFLKNDDEWCGLSELLSNLIAKYADVLDIDSMPTPDISSKDTDTPNKLNKNQKDSIADSSVM